MTPRPGPLLRRTSPDGRREVGWRLRDMGRGLTRLFYASQGNTLTDRGLPNDRPVFLDRWSDGPMTEARSGMTHPSLDFPVRSPRQIRYSPDPKRDVVLPGIHNWIAPSILLGLAAMLLPSGLCGSARARAWVKGR